MNLEDFKRSSRGQTIGDILLDPEWQIAMVTLGKHGLPPAQAVGAEIESRLGTLSYIERQHTGRWIKEVLAAHGQRVERRGARVAAGNGFTRAATYAPTMDDFRAELETLFARSAKRGADHVEVNSGELHRAVGGYPGPGHRMPMCCNAMYQAQTAGDLVVSRPPSGMGASLSIRYKLPRP